MVHTTGLGNLVTKYEPPYCLPICDCGTLLWESKMNQTGAYPV